MANPTIMNKLFLLLGVIFLSLTACVDNSFDEPEFLFEDPDIEVTTSIAQLKATHVNGQFEQLESGVISGIVVANDKSGNFYETIVIADATGGIEVKLEKRSLFNTFPVGRRVFVKLAGLVMGDYNELIQIGFATGDNGFTTIPSEYVDDFVTGGSLNNAFQVDTLTIQQLSESYMSMLVVLKDVQFTQEELGKTYADGQFKLTVNRDIENCSGREIILRTSGYASFASQTVPDGKGTITAVLSRYRDDFQLYLRDTVDIDFSGDRCDGNEPGEIQFDKDFEDGKITSGGWTTQLLTGSVNWEAYQFSGEYFARITNYVGGSNIASDAWLISPETDLSEFENPALNFRTACNYTGQELEIYITDSYDGSSKPVPSQWTELAAPISSGAWDWVESGDVSLSAFSGKKVHVAFRYQGTNTSGKTWEVDDIGLVEGQGGTGGQIVFQDGFDNGLASWNAFNVVGAQVWEHSTQYGNPGSCARMSGFSGSSFANEDWLISPAINLTQAVNASFEFETAKNYTGNDLEIMLSKEYTGTGDPNAVNWVKITPALSTGSWAWTPSGPIDLSGYLGETLYFAFKFTSTNSASATWEVDNVKVFVE